MKTSRWLSAAASMRTTAPPGGGCGSGNSSTLRFSGPPTWCKRTARIERSSSEGGWPDERSGDPGPAEGGDAARRIERREAAHGNPQRPGRQESPVRSQSEASGDRVAGEVVRGQLDEGRLQERRDRRRVEHRLPSRGEHGQGARGAGRAGRLAVLGPDDVLRGGGDHRNLIGQAIARSEPAAEAARQCVAPRLQIGSLESERERRRVQKGGEKSDSCQHADALPRRGGRGSIATAPIDWAGEVWEKHPIAAR